ncbi:hypothetical protein [Leptospira santarosai]|nr:hypothetical protein [Leptospira santarosai]EMO73423.1 hypothetical protein LEP1GSC130_2702 [Leptospira santarosai str. 200403458]
MFAELNDTALYGSQRQVLGQAVSTILWISASNFRLVFLKKF